MVGSVEEIGVWRQRLNVIWFSFVSGDVRFDLIVGNIGLILTADMSFGSTGDVRFG